MFDPWGIAAAVFEKEGDAVFYHTALSGTPLGDQSILAWGEKDRVIGAHFSDLAPKLSDDQSVFENAWFGYFAYELKEDLEASAPQLSSPVSMPRVSWRQFAHHLVFNHSTETVAYYGQDDSAVPDPITVTPAKIQIDKMDSLISQKDYLKKIHDLKGSIVNGDLLQSNLTRKIAGQATEAVGPIKLFKTLCEGSPAAYASLLRLDGDVILSSSPEQFLSVSKEGAVMTRPIKGTIQRGKTAKEDAANKEQLSLSEKDRAENLMIVDLSRNDLSRTCEPGSVKTQALFEIETYKTLHHLSSTVCGQKQSGLSVLDIVKGAFPPGSMTGAPKVMAMQKAEQLEGVERGVYSGSIGWFGGDGSCDLSVVIRTLLMRGKQFEFQVGGAITADSDPESEWVETCVKAEGIHKLFI